MPIEAAISSALPAGVFSFRASHASRMSRAWKTVDLLPRSTTLAITSFAA